MYVYVCESVYVCLFVYMYVYACVCACECVYLCLWCMYVCKYMLERVGMWLGMSEYAWVPLSKLIVRPAMHGNAADTAKWALPTTSGESLRRRELVTAEFIKAACACVGGAKLLAVASLPKARCLLLAWGEWGQAAGRWYWKQPRPSRMVIATVTIVTASTMNSRQGGSRLTRFTLDPGNQNADGREWPLFTGERCLLLRGEPQNAALSIPP